MSAVLQNLATANEILFPFLREKHNPHLDTTEVDANDIESHQTSRITLRYTDFKDGMGCSSLKGDTVGIYI